MSLSNGQLFGIGAENLRDAGGAQVDDEVLRDLGYAPFDEIGDTIAGSDRLRAALDRLNTPEYPAKGEDIVRSIGSVMCGDCLAEVPAGSGCGHMKVSKNGSITILG